LPLLRPVGSSHNYKKNKKNKTLMAQTPTYGSSPPFLAAVPAISRQSGKKHKNNKNKRTKPNFPPG
jgi:hypothetical protein